MQKQQTTWTLAEIRLALAKELRELRRSRRYWRPIGMRETGELEFQVEMNTIIELGHTVFRQVGRESW